LPASPSDIVVFLRSRNFFGSQVVVFPLLYQLRQWWPDDIIRVVARDELSRYYVTLPWVDEFVRTNGAWENYKQLDSKTRKVVSLHDSSEQFGLVSLLKRVPVRMGFKNSRMSNFKWTHSSQKKADEYIGLSNMNLLRTFADFDPEVAARASMVALAGMANNPSQISDVVLIPGGGSGTFKRWGIENYLLLMDLLKIELGSHTTFGIVLGPSECEEETLLRCLARPDVHLLVNCSIADIAASVLKAKLVVANDCGPCHIAQNAFVPYVGIFHQPNLEWFWTRKNATAIYPDDCSGNIGSVRPEQVLAGCIHVMKTADDDLAADTRVMPWLIKPCVLAG
jgi:ADP-heptose:LPS heptosyltransferase